MVANRLQEMSSTELEQRMQTNDCSSFVSTTDVEVNKGSPGSVTGAELFPAMM